MSDDENHDDLVELMLRLVAERRAGLLRSPYLRLPERYPWAVTEARWPMHLRQPAAALIRWAGHNMGGQPDPPRAMRAAARAVVTALALEDA